MNDPLHDPHFQAVLFSFENNLLPNLISNFNHYMDRALQTIFFSFSPFLNFYFWMGLLFPFLNGTLFPYPFSNLTFLSNFWMHFSFKFSNWTFIPFSIWAFKLSVGFNSISSNFYTIGFNSNHFLFSFFAHSHLCIGFLPIFLMLV